MKFVLKLFVSASLAVILGAASAGVALWYEAGHGTPNATSENPYARAAYAVHDYLPLGPKPEARP